MSTLNNILLTPENHVLIDGQFLWGGIGHVTYQVFGADSHKAVTRYQGREILITSNSNENPVTLPAYPNGIVMVDLATGEQTGLLALPWPCAVHISAPVNREWVLVTTYAPTEPKRKDGYWNAIVRVFLDGSAPEVLCYHGSDTSLEWTDDPVELERRKNRAYTAQPKASVSHDGSRFVFASNSGVPDGPVDTWLGVIGGTGDRPPEISGVPLSTISPLPPPPPLGVPLWGPTIQTDPDGPDGPPLVYAPPQPPKSPVKKRGFWAWLKRLFGIR